MLVSAPGGVWSSELAKDKHEEVGWLWNGFLAQGAITLLTGSYKAGKSTLIALLLERRRAGGELLGRSVQPGGTIVLTEEPPPMWARRQAKLDFGPKVCFYCRPFHGIPSLRRWRRFLDGVSQQQDEHGIDLLIIDPAVCFLPAAENHAASLVKALTELQGLTEEGMAVLLLHHPRRGATAPGQGSRGSGALPAFADIILEFRLPAGDPATRRRRLHGFGRFDAIPRHLLAELNADGTDYLLLPDDQPDDTAELDTICAVLRDQPAPLTRDEILARWPAATLAPTANTLWRWLGRGVEVGVLVREGAGTKTEPFRYGVAG